MKFRTAVSVMTKDDLVLRGVKLSSLVGSAPFAEAVFLLLAGRKPSRGEARLFDAILTSCIDHGTGTASALSSRFVASTGNPLNASVAAGVLALGEYHGGAIEAAMRQFLKVQERLDADKRDLAAVVKDFVAESLEQRVRLMGFGHKVYKDADPRVTQLFRIAEEAGVSSPFFLIARRVEEELAAQKGKKLVLNIDGFIAAALLAMSFPPEVGKGVFIIARTPGLVAHAVEERLRERPVRRLDEDEITYDGE